MQKVIDIGAVSGFVTPEHAVIAAAVRWSFVQSIPVLN